MGSGALRSKTPMLSRPRNPPGEHVAPGRILPIHPPVEIQHQALKRLFQETAVRPAEVPFHLVQIERRPGVHRRIHVAEVPLVGGNLPVGVGVETAQHQQQLLLGEIEIHQRQRNRMKRQVPGRVPGILPLVRHGDHVGVEHVEPFGVPHAVPGGFEQRMALVLAQPSLEVEVVELLAPQHARQRLAVHAPFIVVQRLRRNPIVEFVRVRDPALECLLEPAEGIADLETPDALRRLRRPQDADSRSCCRQRARRGHSGPQPWSRSSRG